jgi:hypothetical protein
MNALEFFIDSLTNAEFSDVSLFAKLNALVEARPNILNEVNEVLLTLECDDIDRLDAKYKA